MQNLGDFPNASQFSALFGDAKGFALLASSNAISSANIAEAKSQEMAGSIIVFPPQDWKIERRRIARWLAEDAGGVFDGLPYTFDDIVPFAGVNFSPDRWYVVRRGPMAGSICLWTHDGDSVMEEPWANDLRSWAERVWAELPDVLCGLVRFTASDSIDECPDDAELYPVEFLRDMHAQ
ncbi:MAG: hypothetical protein U0570_11485 [Phycisphaerales bacterium]